MTSLSIAEFSDQLLTWMVTFGSPMLALALFMGALGIPLPGTFFVLAAGAFIRQGALDYFSTPLVGLVGVVIGDVLSYGLGRFGRGWILNKYGESKSWQKAENYFDRKGGFAIFLTRWLFTPLAVPTNLVAGTSGYSFWRFISYDISGEIVWLLLYGGLGYAFGSQWELISDFVSDFSGVLAGILVLGVGIYAVTRSRDASDESDTADVPATSPVEP